MGRELFAQLESAAAMLMGRVTYAEFATFWPRQPAAGPFADLNDGMRKSVVSTTLDRADWNNTTLIGGSTSEAVRELKREPGGRSM